jgi:PilZ domain
LQARFSARDAMGAGTLTFTSEDVSPGGAFLRSELLLEPGEMLALSFDVPGVRAVDTQARVAWVRRFPERGQPSGMGVEFLSMGTDDRHVVAGWLRR